MQELDAQASLARSLQEDDGRSDYADLTYCIAGRNLKNLEPDSRRAIQIELARYSYSGYHKLTHRVSALLQNPCSNNIY